jgi:hypothetical protein
LAFSVLEKLSHSERLARQARNSSRSAFFKKPLIIVTLRQQRRNKGVGAAGRGFGLQQTHTSDESLAAVGDLIGIVVTAGGIGQSKRDSSSGSVVGRQVATVRVTNSARLAAIVPAVHHRSPPRARSCHKEPSVFRIIPTVAGSASTAKKTSPRSRRIFTARSSAGRPSLVAKPMCAGFCFIFGTVNTLLATPKASPSERNKKAYRSYIGRTPPIFTLFREEI